MTMHVLAESVHFLLLHAYETAALVRRTDRHSLVLDAHDGTQALQPLPSGTTGPGAP